MHTFDPPPGFHTLTLTLTLNPDDETMLNTCQVWSKLFHHFVLEMICHYERILEPSGAFFGLLRGYNFQKTI